MIREGPHFWKCRQSPVTFSTLAWDSFVIQTMNKSINPFYNELKGVCFNNTLEALLFNIL